MKKYKKHIVPLILAIFMVIMSTLACQLKNPDAVLLYVRTLLKEWDDFMGRSDMPEYLKEEPEKPAAGDDYGSLAEESEPVLPVIPNAGIVDDTEELPLKPVGFINYGTINATVRTWTYVPLGATQPKTPPPSASTVSTAQGTGGDWPNSSRFISVPLGTYTWCIDWEEEDQDEDGYFDYYHYYETETTLLDENDSDELDFAEEVAISAPPDTAPIYKGKCGESEVIASCYGKTTFVQTFVRHVNHEPIYPMDVQAVANTAYQEAPEGISISFSGGAGDWVDGKILWNPGDWIEATTSDPYSAMGVQIFGDETIGWARILFDGSQIWEEDTSEAVIDPNENSGLGWYGIYVEVLCFPPGTHTLRVETGQTKEGVGGWQGGVPVHLFGFRW